MDSIETKAYSIFVSEVKRHIEGLEGLFSRTGANTEAELKEARISAHRLKGGAGFFGLTALGEVAATLEVAIEKYSPSELEKIQNLIKTLHGLTDKMPAPKASV